MAKKSARFFLSGELLYVSEDKLRKEILDEWEKSKKLSDDATRELLPGIFNRCNIQAVILTKEVNLPPPFKLPSIKMDKE